VFDVGEEREVIESKIQKCIDSAKDITLQLTNVEFVDGKEWNSSRANKVGRERRELVSQHDWCGKD